MCLHSVYTNGEEGGGGEGVCWCAGGTYVSAPKLHLTFTHSARVGFHVVRGRSADKVQIKTHKKRKQYSNPVCCKYSPVKVH